MQEEPHRTMRETEIVGKPKVLPASGSDAIVACYALTLGGAGGALEERFVAVQSIISGCMMPVHQQIRRPAWPSSAGKECRWPIESPSGAVAVGEERFADQVRSEQELGGFVGRGSWSLDRTREGGWDPFAVAASRRRAVRA